MERKRAGVLTFHMAHNYGAMLQAYALPTAMERLGYACEVIDYRFGYIDQWSRVEYLEDLLWRYGCLGGGLRYCKRLLTGCYARSDMRNRFARFERRVIPKSRRIYRDKKDLAGLSYDAILFGSDQIWNSALTDGPAEEYVGAFPVGENTRKIAYAASCGCADFQPESRDAYLQAIGSFSAVGVREKGLEETLKAQGIQAQTVLDPTLLLEKADWLRVSSRPAKHSGISGPYLLVYAFDENEALYDCVRRFARERGLEIVVIAYEKKPCMDGMLVLTDQGPAEFVSLFAGADAVVTTSFHGTAFSIIMQRDFYCVPHPKYRERTDSLLALFGLQGRNAEALSQIGCAPPVDWKQVNAVLGSERQKSLNFLRQAMEQTL